MSQQRVLEALVKLGLSINDAQIYIYLAKEGPQKTEAIMETLKVYEQQVTLSLKSLETKGIVRDTNDQGMQFMAVPFDKALDLLLRAHWRKTRTIQQNRTEILSQWESLVKRDIAR